MTGAKRKSRGFYNLIERGFVENVGYQQKGRAKKMPRLDLMVLQKILGAMQGDPGCIRFLLKHIKRDEAPPVQRDVKFEFVFPDGHREFEFYDGRREIKHCDGRAELTWPDGARLIEHPDGRIEAIEANGEVIWTSTEEMEALGWPKTTEALKLARGY